MEELSNDELEEKGLIECCLHCNGLHITVEDNGTHYCNTCGTVGFVEVITEEEYERRIDISC